MNLNLLCSAISLMLVQFALAEEKAANVQVSTTSDKADNAAQVADEVTPNLSDSDVLVSIRNVLAEFGTTVDESAKKFEEGMIASGKVKSLEDIQKLSDARGDFSDLSNEYIKMVKDFQNVVWTEFLKLQEHINLILSDFPKSLESLKKPLEVIRFAAPSCPGCSYLIYRYVRLLEQLIDRMKEAPQSDFSKDIDVFSSVYQRCTQNLRYAPHTVDFSEILSLESGKNAEEKAKKEAEEKAKKEAEDSAKKEAEDKAKKEAEEKAKKEAEEKAKKEAEDKAKKEAEKKEVEDKADGLKEGVGNNEGHLSDQASNFVFGKQHIRALQETAQKVVAQAGKMRLNVVFFTLKNELEKFVGKKGREVLGCLKKNLENLPENRDAYTLMVEYMNRISVEGEIKWNDEEEKKLKERKVFFEKKRAMAKR